MANAMGLHLRSKKSVVVACVEVRKSEEKKGKFGVQRGAMSRWGWAQFLELNISRENRGRDLLRIGKSRTQGKFCSGNRRETTNENTSLVLAAADLHGQQ